MKLTFLSYSWIILRITSLVYNSHLVLESSYTPLGFSANQPPHYLDWFVYSNQPISSHLLLLRTLFRKEPVPSPINMESPLQNQQHPEEGKTLVDERRSTSQKDIAPVYPKSGLKHTPYSFDYEKITTRYNPELQPPFPRDGHHYLGSSTHE